LFLLCFGFVLELEMHFFCPIREKRITHKKKQFDENIENEIVKSL